MHSTSAVDVSIQATSPLLGVGGGGAGAFASSFFSSLAGAGAAFLSSAFAAGAAGASAAGLSCANTTSGIAVMPSMQNRATEAASFLNDLVIGCLPIALLRRSRRCGCG